MYTSRNYRPVPGHFAPINVAALCPRLANPQVRVERFNPTLHSIGMKPTAAAPSVSKFNGKSLQRIEVPHCRPLKKGLGTTRKADA